MSISVDSFRKKIVNGGRPLWAINNIEIIFLVEGFLFNGESELLCAKQHMKTVVRAMYVHNHMFIKSKDKVLVTTIQAWEPIDDIMKNGFTSLVFIIITDAAVILSSPIKESDELDDVDVINKIGITFWIVRTGRRLLKDMFAAVRSSQP